MKQRNLKVLATICARGGSKGVPGKNIRPLLGKPLIAYTLEIARQCVTIDEFIVSTDSPDISAVVKSLGYPVPFLRPAELATDTAGKRGAILHAVKFVEAQYGFFPAIVLDLDVGAPLRSPEDISACVAKLANDPKLDAVVTMYAAERNPYFNMVEMTGNRINLVKTGKPLVSRQEAPRVYSLSGSVFAWRREKLESVAHLFEGRWGGCLIPRERAIDIDTEIDFQFCEFLLRQQRGFGSDEARGTAISPAPA